MGSTHDGRDGERGTLPAGLPPNAVARRQDGVILVVPGEPGDLAALDRDGNPEFYDREGAHLGTIDISGINEDPTTCALFAISNLSRVRGAVYLIAWYLTRHTAAKTFVVRRVNSQRLQRLLERLGMRLAAGGRDMVGSSAAVHDLARKKCHRHRWQLMGAPPL